MTLMTSNSPICMALRSSCTSMSMPGRPGDNKHTNLHNTEINRRVGVCVVCVSFCACMGV